jgi:hypothetical protein
MTHRRSLRVDDPQVSVVQALQAATAHSRDVPYIDSQAEIYRYLLDQGIDRVLDDADPDLDAAEVTAEDISESTLGVLLPKSAVVEYQRDQIKDEARHDFLSIDVAGRFARKADELFEGEVHKPHPDGVENIAEKYVAEVEMYAEYGYLSDRDAEQQRRSIRDRMQTYRQEYEAAQHAPEMRDVPPEVELGQAVARLRQDNEAFLSDLRDRAEQPLTNPDDVVRAMASIYGVSETVVDALLDTVTPDGMPGRHALREQHADVLDAAEADGEIESETAGAISDD